MKERKYMPPAKGTKDEPRLTQTRREKIGFGAMRTDCKNPLLKYQVGEGNRQSNLLSWSSRKGANRRNKGDRN